MSTSTNNSRLKFTYFMHLYTTVYLLLATISVDILFWRVEVLLAKIMEVEVVVAEAGLKHGNSVLWI